MTRASPRLLVLITQKIRFGEIICTPSLFCHYLASKSASDGWRLKTALKVTVFSAKLQKPEIIG